MRVLTGEPLSESELTEIIGDGELVPLLAALAHLTGDHGYVAAESRPRAKTVLGRAVPGATDEAAVQLAIDGLKKIVGAPAAPSASGVDRDLIEYLVGDPIDDSAEGMLRYQLGLPNDQGAPTWQRSKSSESRHPVAIIGAGMSGILMARRLDQAGIPYIVFERNEAFGGVWHENTYPGCRVDTTNYIYSYSFATRDSWKHDFSLQSAVRDYLSDVAKEYGIDKNVRFATDVVAATYNEENCIWQLDLDGPDGAYKTEFSAVISAVGQLNQPKIPEISGLESFAGPTFHTARWDHDVDLTGKNVAVIGTGASAYQVIPEIAEQVGSLTVFQRSAPWMEWTPSYTDEVKPGLRWLFENVPTYSNWHRAYQFWITADARRPYYSVDPTWNRSGSVSAENEELRQHLVAGLERQYQDRPDLLEKVIPTYPPYSKRLLRDNGKWAKTLHQPNVRLVTDGIESVNENGICTAKEQIDIDVIIFATGFRASEILAPVDVTGTNGRKLRDEWSGDPKAYMGITVPGFPNLFCLYGPNTNVVVSSSLFFFAESAGNLILSALEHLEKTSGGAVECTAEALDQFIEDIDAASSLTAWGASDESTWYKGATGRVSQNWPLRVLDYWNGTRELPLEKFKIHFPAGQDLEVAR